MCQMKKSVFVCLRGGGGGGYNTVLTEDQDLERASQAWKISRKVLEFCPDQKLRILYEHAEDDSTWCIVRIACI